MSFIRAYDLNHSWKGDLQLEARQRAEKIVAFMRVLLKDADYWTDIESHIAAEIQAAVKGALKSDELLGKASAMIVKIAVKKAYEDAAKIIEENCYRVEKGGQREHLACLIRNKAKELNSES